MVTTRVFIKELSRTVISKPALIPAALRMYNSTRARQSKGIKRFFPSRRYLKFRLYTQYGNEEVPRSVLREDIATYLKWVKSNS